MLIKKLLRVAILTLTLSLLSSCYLVPGSFDAALDIRGDGRFTYRYVGEIVFALPERPSEDAWSDSNAHCFDIDKSVPRSCTSIEIKEQRQRYEAQQERSKQSADEVAELIGFNAYDTAANQKIASDMMHHKGFKNVVYKGGGVFAVEYEISGTLDRDFIFPTMPNSQVIIPFLSIHPSKKGVVNIAAPGLTGGVTKTVIMGQMPKSDEKDLQYFGRINGNFKLTTNAELSFYNSTLARNTGSNQETTVNWQINRGEANLTKGKSPEAELILP